MIQAAKRKPRMTAAQREGARRTFRGIFERGRPRILPTFVELAENKIRTKEGDRLSLTKQPFARLVLQEFDNRHWNRHMGMGCVQSGKTLLYLVCPASMYLFERRQDFGCGVPQMEVAAAKWRDEFKGCFTKSYRDELPKNGTGSRDGKKFEAITFAGGTTLVFLSGGGKSEKRSGLTLEAIAVTETDKADAKSARPAGNQDPNPTAIPEMEGRLASKGDNSRFWGECTVTTKKGYIHREWKAGSASEIWKKCPHCHKPVLPGRADFVGWDGAKDEMEAREGATFICPECKEIIMEEERRTMCEGSVLVHRGQTVRVDDQTGALVVEGPLPPTRTCGIRWSAFDNLFWTYSWLGWKCWRAANSTDPDDEESSEKWVSQYVWVEPWEPDAFEVTPLDVKEVRARTRFPQRLVPPETRFIAGAADLGKWWGHYVIPVGRSERKLNVIDYGKFDVPSDAFNEDEAVYRALCTLRDEVIEPGFVDDDGKRWCPGFFFIDSNWRQDPVFRFIRDSWAMGLRRYLPSLGRGVSQMNTSGNYVHPKAEKDGQTIGHQYFLEWLGRPEFVWRAVVNADFWKAEMRSALAMEVGKPGSLELFAADPKEHTTFAKHVVAEFEEMRYVKDKGLVKRHVNRGRRPNHFGDGLYNSLAALHLCGFRFDDAAPAVVRETDHPVEPLYGPDGEPFLALTTGANL